MTEEKNDIKLETENTNEVKPLSGLMSRFNNSNVFDIDTSKYKYVSLQKLYDTNPEAQYKVLGFYINTKGKYGSEPNAIIEHNMIVNLPRHLLETVNELLDSNEYIKYIKDGHVGFGIYQYHSSKYNRDAYSVTWLDI